MKSKLIIYSILLFCVIAWGSNFIFGSILVNVFKPEMIAVIRLIFILIFLYFLTFRIVRQHKLSFHHYLWLALAGFIGVSINQWSFYASLQYTDPILAALILALSPIVTSLLSSYYFHEKRKILFWVGSIIALLGVWLVITNGSMFIPVIGKGELLIGLTMLSFSVFLLFVQKLSRTIHPVLITWYSNLFGIIGLLPFIPWKEVSVVFSVPLRYWGLLIVTAIIMHGLCTYLWNNSIHKVGAAKASLLLNLEPFIAMVVGFIVLGKGISVIQLIGACIILIGVSISLWTKQKLLST